MRYNMLEKKVEDINIAYIGGGSKNWARVFMNDMALEKSLSGKVKLYDIDYESAILNEKIGNRISSLKEAEGKWEYEAVERIEDALIGADFVFISILPGNFQDMYRDVHYPEEIGIIQSVGDTVGLGGTTRAWRTVPLMKEIGKNIKNYSPDAWVINFTNPMTFCIKTLYEVFPKIKAYGCCHEVFGTQHLMIKALKEFENIEVAKIEDIKINVLGINHFTWITQATYQGIDLIPIYRRFAEKYLESGFLENEEHWMNNHFKSGERVKFDLFMKYGYPAAAGDRHLVEFLPNRWYLHNNLEWKFGLTKVNWRIENQKKLIEDTQLLAEGEKMIEIKKSGEDFVRQIKGILGMEDIVTNVNLPNVGQISNISRGVIVETNAYFTKDSVRAINAGDVPEELLMLMEPHLKLQKKIVEASLERDEEKLFKCYISDPQSMGSGREELRKIFISVLNKKS
ncbi:MAG: alpha-glucosidase/alpha-galactosidase [Cetobacterium sp.]